MANVPTKVGKKDELRRDFDSAIAGMKTLRDEIKLHIHLAGMELRDAWKSLEPRLGEAERFADEISDATLATTQELGRRFRELRDNLKKVRDQNELSRPRA